MRRLHLIDRPQNFPHVTYDDDPDAIPDCPCGPEITECEGVVIVRHRTH